MLSSATVPCLMRKTRSPQSRTARFLTVNILIAGKKTGAEDWIRDGCAEYEKRLRSAMKIETKYVKAENELVNAAAAARGHVIALDENGRQYNSVEFSKVLYDGFEGGGSHVSFIIGGFSGLPTEIKKKYPLMSLSKMTWTHQMARLLLVEQIYRAAEIYKGSNYHKQ